MAGARTLGEQCTNFTRAAVTVPDIDLVRCCGWWIGIPQITWWRSPGGIRRGILYNRAMHAGTAKTAFFWDESFLWGIIARRTFRELGIAFELLTGEDIRAGRLAGYDILFVPGGWASDKIVALGDAGRESVRAFVEGGGSYLGICGGAGLALSHESGLALAPVTRVPTKLRVPSFSGSIVLKQTAAGHPMWQGVGDGTAFHAWWPGQFSLGEDGGVTVLARYGKPAGDAFVTDLPVHERMDWEAWEQSYGINLDPGRLEGEPAVIETGFGRGKVLLSYLHFETPGDSAGHRVLLNILSYLAGGKPVVAGAEAAEAAGTAEPTPAGVAGAASRKPDAAAGRQPAGLQPVPGSDPAACCCDPKAAARDNDARFAADDLRAQARQLMDFGVKNYLWYQRNDWILQWRRGVRGVEYSTLYAMLDELAEAVNGHYGFSVGTVQWLKRLRSLARPFFETAPQLLLLERDALGRGPISPMRTDDLMIRELREMLFSSSKRCGGLYKEIIDQADAILLPLLR